MADPEVPPDVTPPADQASNKKSKDPGASDVVALGIGCLIFIIFFVAIVVVNISRD